MMLTLKQYLDQFNVKEHAAEMKLLLEDSGVSKTHLYAIRGGASCRLDVALSLYRSSNFVIDPRTMCQSVNWEILDVYYDSRYENSKAGKRAGKPAVAGKAGARADAAGSGAGKANAADGRRTPRR
jgi:hypothetical protein